MKVFWWTLVGCIALVAPGSAWAEATSAHGDAQAITSEPVSVDAETDAEADAAESAEAAAEVPSLARRLWTLIGVFHPAIIHFPIVLLTLAALLVMMRLVFRSVPEDLAFYCLVLGAGTAVVASAIGWSFATQQGYVRIFDTGSRDAATMFFHRWFGIGTTVLAVVFAAVAVVARRRGQRRGLRVTWQLGAVATAALVGLVGHWGGSLVYGHDMYARAFERFVESGRPPQATPPAGGSNGVAANGAGAGPIVTMPEDGVIDFATHIQPIFETHCLECHGPRRQRGDLRLDTREDAFTTGSFAPYNIVPGDVDDSELYWMLTGEFGDVMPPEENGGPLPDELIEIVRLWIEQGAEWPEGLVLTER